VNALRVWRARVQRATRHRLSRDHVPVENVSQGDPSLSYTWSTHLAAKHTSRDEEAIKWAERALERREDLGEGETYTRKVGRLLEVRARAASNRWEAAQQAYLTAGRPPDLEQVEISRRARAKSFAREWLEFVTAARMDPQPARTLCESVAGGAEPCRID
jgi:hypothetical protein